MFYTSITQQQWRAINRVWLRVGGIRWSHSMTFPVFIHITVSIPTVIFSANIYKNVEKYRYIEKMCIHILISVHRGRYETHRAKKILSASCEVKRGSFTLGWFFSHFCASCTTDVLLSKFLLVFCGGVCVCVLLAPLPFSCAWHLL